MICIVKESLNGYVPFIVKSEFRRIIATMLLCVIIIGLAMSFSGMLHSLQI